MSCCGQKRSEQKHAARAGASTPGSQQRGWQVGHTVGRERPRDPRANNAGLLDYLTRNGKLFNAR
jgi:hypothetical protein